LVPPPLIDVLGTLSSVIAGLDPAIHAKQKRLASRMDPRVKPEGDNRKWLTRRI